MCLHLWETEIVDRGKGEREKETRDREREANVTMHACLFKELRKPFFVLSRILFRSSLKGFVNFSCCWNKPVVVQKLKYCVLKSHVYISYPLEVLLRISFITVSSNVHNQQFYKHFGECLSVLIIILVFSLQSMIWTQQWPNKILKYCFNTALVKQKNTEEEEEKSRAN